MVSERFVEVINGTAYDAVSRQLSILGKSQNRASPSSSTSATDYSGSKGDARSA